MKSYAIHIDSLSRTILFVHSFDSIRKRNGNNNLLLMYLLLINTGQNPISLQFEMNTNICAHYFSSLYLSTITANDYSTKLLTAHNLFIIVVCRTVVFRFQWLCGTQMCFFFSGSHLFPLGGLSGWSHNLKNFIDGIFQFGQNTLLIDQLPMF